MIKKNNKKINKKKIKKTQKIKVNRQHLQIKTKDHSDS